MADQKTAEWAKKSKQIESERLKAARDLNTKKPEKANLAFLGPKLTKGGWSKDTNAILASAEKIGNRSSILAFAGVVLGIIGMAGDIVSELNNLGLAGVMIGGLPSSISYFCLGLAVLMAAITVGSEIYYKIKQSRKFSSSFWSAIGAISVVALYFTVRWLIIRFG
jgi:hypothetical protein